MIARRARSSKRMGGVSGPVDAAAVDAVLGFFDAMLGVLRVGWFDVDAS
jgi:hypothetical protein